jgi:two-component system, cell cycle response regulator
MSESGSDWSRSAATEEHTLFTTRGGGTGETANIGGSSQRPALLVQRGPTIGDWYLFPEGKGELVIGRGDDAAFQVKDASVSRGHACFLVTERDGAAALVHVEDLGSTNGTRVNGVIVEAKAVLDEGDLIRIGDVVLRFRMMDPADIAFQEDISRQVRNARKDTLTGLYSRRYLDEQLPGLMKAHRRNAQPLSLLIIDLDHFKAVNDDHGHLVGDEVLWRVAEAVRATVRSADSAVRYGGEEFCVILPGTARNEAARVGERIRQAIGRLDLSSLAAGLSTTASIGVAALDGEEELHEWLQRADLALYSAKHGGRNQVHIAPATVPPDTGEPAIRADTLPRTPSQDVRNPFRKKD